MNNLFEFTSELKEKIGAWAKNLIKEIRLALSLGNENSSLKNEVGKYLALDTASGLAENNKFVVKAFEGMLEKLKYKRSMDLISEEEYYRELEKLRDRYFAKGTQNWVKYTAEIYKYQKKSLEQEKENIISIYDDISKYASDKLTEVLNKQARLTEKLKANGSIANKNTVTIDGKTETYYSMHNMQEDIRLIKEYMGLMEKFSQRADMLGIDEDLKKSFLKELSEEDFYASISLLNSIKGSTDEAVSDYLNTWNERNMLASSAAAKSLEDEFKEATEDAYENMKEVLMRAGYEIPEGFFASGSLSAQKFGDAFVEEIETQMARIRAVIGAFQSEISGYAYQGGGVTYNTSNTSYNIQAQDAGDTVEQIRRYETVKRLAGIG